MPKVPPELFALLHARFDQGELFRALEREDWAVKLVILLSPVEHATPDAWFHGIVRLAVQHGQVPKLLAVMRTLRPQRAEEIDAVGLLLEKGAAAPALEVVAGDYPPRYAQPQPRKANLPPPNHDFVGRRDELDRLHKLLATGRPVALDQRPGSLTGLGGVGKSQLAYQYGQEHLKDYKHICLVNAKGEDLAAAVADLARDPLGLALDPALPAERAAAAVLAHLEGGGPHLLILDNVDHPDAWRQWVPNGDVQVLITTVCTDLSGVQWGSESHSRKLILRQSAFERQIQQEMQELQEVTEQIELISGNSKAPRRSFRELKRKRRAGPELEPGDRLRKDESLHLKKIVGTGGFGTVWSARDTTNNRMVAVKVLHGQFARDESRRERFFSGAKRMNELAHAHLVKVFDERGEDHGWCWFSMEYVPGGDLASAIKDNHLSQERWISILKEVAGVLDYLHSKDFVHRDVKPENILLDEAGRAKLTDFDLVAAADSFSIGGSRTAMFGTFLYAAPECLERAAEAGPQADIFGLATTAVSCISGRPPPAELLRNQALALDQLGIIGPERLVLEKGRDYNYCRRHGSATEFMRSLEEALFGLEGAVAGPTTEQRIQIVRDGIARNNLEWRLTLYALSSSSPQTRNPRFRLVLSRSRILGYSKGEWPGASIVGV